MLPIDIYNKYATDGAVVVRRCIDACWIDKLQGAVDRDIESPGPFMHSYTSEDSSAQFHGNLRVW